MDKPFNRGRLPFKPRAPARPRRQPGGTRRKVTVTLPTELMQRLDVIERASNLRAVNLSALFAGALRTWLDERDGA